MSRTLLLTLVGISLHAATPQPLAQQAKEAMASGHFAEAVTLYRAILRDAPGSPEIRFNLALALHSEGKYTDAVTQLDQVVKRAPGLVNAWLILGLAHQKLGHPEMATEPFERVLKADPENKLALLELGDANLAQGKLQNAAQNFELLSKLDPASSKSWEGLGVIYLSLARQVLEQFESDAPVSSYTLALLAQSRLNQKQYRSAFALARQALASDPAIPDMHECIASIYRATSHSDWAEIEQAKARSMNHAGCDDRNLGCRFFKRQLSEIIVLTSHTDHPESLYWRSRAYSELAGDALHHLAALPESAELHEVLGEAHCIDGRKEDCIREWRQAVRLAPEDAYAENGLAKALWQHRDYTESQPILERLLKRSPESPDLNYEMGDILLEQQNAEEAVPLLKKAVSIAPKLNAAHGALGRALLKLGRAKEAIGHLEAALPHDEDGSLHYQLGRAWQQIGDDQKAKQCFEKQKAILAAKTTPVIESTQITPP